MKNRDMKSEATKRLKIICIAYQECIHVGHTTNSLNSAVEVKQFNETWREFCQRGYVGGKSHQSVLSVTKY